MHYIDLKIVFFAPKTQIGQNDKVEIVHTNNNGDVECEILNDTDYSIKALGCCLVFLSACFFCFYIQK